jgi:putative ABC transport system permease protein
MLRHGARPVVIGVAVGLGLALWGGRLAETFLLGVGPRDPVTLTSVAALLALVGFVATYLPARRAARVNPIQALRVE